MKPIRFDLMFEAYSWREQGSTGRRGTVDMGVTRNNHTNIWGELSRAQLKFINERIAAYLDDTSRDQNWVYAMECGHEYDSWYRLSPLNRAHCSQHGFQRVISGDFLPTWEQWVRARKAARAARKNRRA